MGVDKGLTATDICGAANTSYKDTRAALQEMLEDGMLYEADGSYFLLG